MQDGFKWAGLNDLNAPRAEDRPGAEAYPPPYGIAEVPAPPLGMRTGRGGMSVIAGSGAGSVLA